MTASPSTQSANPNNSPTIHRRFNHDLLISPADQAAAAARWPAIAHALINPELIEAFKPHEEQAKKDKKIVQWLGTFSVLLMMAALFGAAWELWVRADHVSESQAAQHWELTLPRCLEIAAIGGLVLAILASRYGPFRRRWLKHRFITEVLRQWHFRRLLDGPAIDASLTPHGQAHYLQVRREKLAALVHELRDSAGQKMDKLVEDRADPLDPIPAPHLPGHEPARRQMVEVYQTLRLDHQLDFAVYKLSADDKTFLSLPGKALVWITDQLSGATLLVALVLSVLLLFQVHPWEWAPFVMMLLVIAGIVVRTWRDGLALGEERERYQEMRHRLELLQTRWEDAADDNQKFALSTELEQAALEELRGFIREHEKAQFLI